jgi:hypothetical protein
MPPAWVDFSWAMVRKERDNVKQISVVTIICQQRMTTFGTSQRVI